MIEADEFDMLTDAVLRETANPELPHGFAARMSAAMDQQQIDKEYQMAASTMVADRELEQSGMDVSTWPSFGTRPGLTALFGSRRTVVERRGFGPVGWALAFHAAALLVAGTWLAERPRQVPLSNMAVVPLLEAPAPMKLPPRATTSGGGGGQSSPVPAAQGRLPRFAETQIVPPTAPPMQQPKLAVEPTVVMQHDLRMANNDLPNLGLPNSPIVGTGSLGGGSGTGIGSGTGAGLGAGLGGNTGGGTMRVGGGVSAPVPVFMPDPEFSEEARKAKISGNVLVYLWVDQDGRPAHVRVVRGIGMGLDERAVAAVRQYRFKPARKDGRPVTVEMNVEVNFQIF